jgi:NodT family efflux transporter outer membrane factor (OMF) lipoprotein
MHTKPKRWSPARLAAAALAVTILAGCAAAGPDYQQPLAPAAPSYYNQRMLDAHSANQASADMTHFWQGFNDSLLSGLIDRALDANLDLAIAKTRVAQSRALARQAGANLLPSGELSTSVLKEQQSLQDPIARIASNFPGYSRDQTLYNVGAGASWETDLFGGNRRRAEAALARAGASQAEQDALRILVVSETADAYFRLRGAQARITAIEDEVKVNSDLLELVHDRLHEGLATAREEAEAEGLLYQARAALPPLRMQVALEANRLDVLMGATPGRYASDTANAAPIRPLPGLSAGQAPADLLKRRPDVIAAERRLAAANAGIGVATAEYYPHLSLAALLGQESYRAGDLFSQSTFQPQALLGIRWRLFDFGRVDAEVAQAQGAYAEALLDYKRTMLNATADVENAIVRLAASEARQDELNHQVVAQERARSTAEDAYKGGAAGLFEVLEEQRQLIAARDQLEEARAADAVALVDTFKALGGGW